MFLENFQILFHGKEYQGIIQVNQAPQL